MPGGKFWTIACNSVLLPAQIVNTAIRSWKPTGLLLQLSVSYRLCVVWYFVLHFIHFLGPTQFCMLPEPLTNVLTLNLCIFHICAYAKNKYIQSSWNAQILGNVGQDHAVFEQGASAGNVGNVKVVEQKKANPVALLLSSAMMLRHLQFPSFADRLETAVKRVIAEGKYRTKDLGGTSTTQEVTDAVIANLD